MNAQDQEEDFQDKIQQAQPDEDEPTPESDGEEEVDQKCSESMITDTPKKMKRCAKCCVPVTSYINRRTKE